YTRKKPIAAFQGITNFSLDAIVFWELQTKGEVLRISLSLENDYFKRQYPSAQNRELLLEFLGRAG
ncbi:MAG: hypothetical protein OXF24_03565, partial [Hyphomicrobiales bacterium]|nr:hypothetical protein [Hyphomicrobiales bacterium]